MMIHTITSLNVTDNLSHYSLVYEMT